MKKIILSLALLSFSFSSLASDPIVWNNKGEHTQVTLKKGDTVTIKVNARKYVTNGVISSICSAKWVKINGYFVAVENIEVITKYNTVR